MNENGKVLMLSAMPKTWIFDFDGTLVKHNGYKIDGEDTLLPGAAEFMKSLPQSDMIILITSRTQEFANQTVDFLCEHGIRFDHIIYNAPFGERILINDMKNSGLPTSFAINTVRDQFLDCKFECDSTL